MVRCKTFYGLDNFLKSEILKSRNADKFYLNGFTTILLYLFNLFEPESIQLVFCSEQEKYLIRFDF